MRTCRLLMSWNYCKFFIVVFLSFFVATYSVFFPVKRQRKCYFWRRNESAKKSQNWCYFFHLFLLCKNNFHINLLSADFDKHFFFVLSFAVFFWLFLLCFSYLTHNNLESFQFWSSKIKCLSSWTDMATLAVVSNWLQLGSCLGNVEKLE